MRRTLLVALGLALASAPVAWADHGPLGLRVHEWGIVAHDLDPREHGAEVEGVRARRIARLRSGTGWLALVDRIWLEPGDNETPIGTLALAPNEDRVLLFLRVAPGRGVTTGGAPAVDGPVSMGDVFEVGGKRYELGLGVDRPCLRVWDPEAPGQAGFGGIEFYPVRTEWRLVARFWPFATPVTITMPFSSGEVGERRSPGALDFEASGRTLRLLPVVEADPTPRLFILFADPTNRGETYPAGRFLYAPMPESGTTVLDFNLAMNPACAFNELVVCPLPPSENRLPLRVEAGEKRYARP